MGSAPRRTSSTQRGAHRALNARRILCVALAASNREEADVNMLEQPHNRRVDVLVGDIADVATLQCEVYVVAANNELWMGSGVAGAIKRAAGEVVEREAQAQGPIQVGGAV